jgi:hypothetical protein
MSAQQIPPICRHPFSDRIVRLVHAVVRTTVDGDGSLAPLRFGRVHLARSFKRARNLDTEVAQYLPAWLCRVVVEKNVVTISPQAWLAANELPDLAQGRPQAEATAPGATSHRTAANIARVRLDDNQLRDADFCPNLRACSSRFAAGSFSAAADECDYFPARIVSSDLDAASSARPSRRGKRVPDPASPLKRS